MWVSTVSQHPLFANGVSNVLIHYLPILEATLNYQNKGAFRCTDGSIVPKMGGQCRAKNRTYVMREGVGFGSWVMPTNSI